MYEGSGRAEPISFRGISEESMDDAIRAAVDASGAEPGSRFVVTHIEVETVGDPNVGSYLVTLSPRG